MPVKELPLRKEIAYAAGMMGWRTMGLRPLVPQLLVFGAFNILSLIAASVRLFDAFYDPFIASVIDGSENPSGRRIPLPPSLSLHWVSCPMQSWQISRKKTQKKQVKIMRGCSSRLNISLLNWGKPWELQYLPC